MRIIKGKSSVKGNKSSTSNSGKKASKRSDVAGLIPAAQFYTAQEFIAEISQPSCYDAKPDEVADKVTDEFAQLGRFTESNKTKQLFEEAEAFLLPKVSDEALASDHLGSDNLARDNKHKSTGKRGRRYTSNAQDSLDSHAELSDTDKGYYIKKEYGRLMAKGIRLLSMREHSVKEISKKLSVKCESLDLVYAVVDELVANKYLSDQRFTESFVRSRQNRGFGPNKIKLELGEKGIGNNLIDDYLDVNSAIWYESAEQQYSKKYGPSPIDDYKTWAKRARFLQSRGFSMEHIQVVVPAPSFD